MDKTEEIKKQLEDGTMGDGDVASVDEIVATLDEDDDTDGSE